MMDIEQFVSRVEIEGNVFISGGDPIDLEGLDSIIYRLLNRWENEEIIIFCSPQFSRDLQNLFKGLSVDDENVHLGIFHNEGQPTATSFICEMSFYRLGLTFHIIEKPNIEHSLWVAMAKDATPTNSLITK